MTAIVRLGKEISNINHMTFKATSLDGSKTDWTGQGSGQVNVVSSLENGRRVVHLYENGIYTPDKGRNVPYQNVYRLTWHMDRIQLHHERRGEENAVWLFDFVIDPLFKDKLVSEAPHPCGKDSYSASLTLDDHGFDMEWKIIGPRKNEYLEYSYRVK